MFEHFFQKFIPFFTYLYFFFFLGINVCYKFWLCMFGTGQTSFFNTWFLAFSNDVEKHSNKIFMASMCCSLKPPFYLWRSSYECIFKCWHSNNSDIWLCSLCLKVFCNLCDIHHLSFLFVNNSWSVEKRFKIKLVWCNHHKTFF